MQPRLEQRLTKVQQAERLEGWYSDYLDREAEQGALASEFVQVYQECTAKLIDLFERVQAFDAELPRLHSARPSGVKEHLLGVELTARGLTGFTTAQPSIIKTAQLPQFENSKQMAWPTPPVINTAVFEPPPPDLRYSRRWYKATAEQNRQREEERERTADFYNDQQQRRTEREAAEAQERAAAARR